MICLDANLIIRRVISPDDEATNNLWARWEKARERFIAPALIQYEIANAFHQYRRNKLLSPEDAGLALRTALAIPIETVHDLDLNQEAFGIANRYNLAAAYDSHYLAVALRHGLEFWTADERLWNSLKSQNLSWLHFLPYAY